MLDHTGRDIATKISNLSVDTTGLVKDTTVQTTNSKLDDIKTAINSISSAISPASSNVTYNNTSSGLTATNVQDAIDELNSEKQDNIVLGVSNAPDFNNLTTSGCYWVSCANSTNSPFTDPSGKYGFLENIRGSNIVLMQRFTLFKGNSSDADYALIYVRFFVNNQWYGWKRRV